MISGQLTISATAQALGEGSINGPMLIRAKSDNSGVVYLGDSTVDSNTGFIIEAGDAVIIDSISSLDHLYAVGTASDVISFLALEI